MSRSRTSNVLSAQCDQGFGQGDASHVFWWTEGDAYRFIRTKQSDPRTNGWTLGAGPPDETMHSIVVLKHGVPALGDTLEDALTAADYYVRMMDASALPADESPRAGLVALLSVAKARYWGETRDRLEAADRLAACAAKALAAFPNGADLRELSESVAAYHAARALNRPEKGPSDHPEGAAGIREPASTPEASNEVRLLGRYRDAQELLHRCEEHGFTLDGLVAREEPHVSNADLLLLFLMFAEDGPRRLDEEE